MYFWDVVWQNAAGRRSGVGGSLHGPCLWRAMNPCWSARWELKLLCCYATSMLVLLAIVWAYSDCRYPQMCYKAKLSEYTRQVTLHCGLSHDLCTSLCDWPPQYIYIKATYNFLQEFAQLCDEQHFVLKYICTLGGKQYPDTCNDFHISLSSPCIH